MRITLVPKKGLEPPHPCEYVDLNHARLPIPPLRHGTQSSLISQIGSISESRKSGLACQIRERAHPVRSSSDPENLKSSSPAIPKSSNAASLFSGASTLQTHRACEIGRAHV